MACVNSPCSDAFAGDVEEAWRRVDRRDVRAGTGGEERGIAGAGAEIEDRLARLDLRELDDVLGCGRQLRRRVLVRAAVPVDHGLATLREQLAQLGEHLARVLEDVAVGVAAVLVAAGVRLALARRSCSQAWRVWW